MSLPDSNFLSAPLWLITILHIVTLSLHFLAMNFLFGGLIVVLLGRMQEKWNDPTVKKFIKLSPSAMAATVTLGVAPLLFLQMVYYGQAYSAAIVSGWYWLAIIDAVIIGYYLLYGSAFTQDRRPDRLPVLLSLAFVALLFVSVIYSSIFSMAERPDLYHRLYAANPSGLALNTDVGSWLFRWLHMLTGAIAVGGFFIGYLGKDNAPAHKLGKHFFLWGMIGAMVLGLVYLFTLGDTILAFMRSPAIWVLTAAIVLSLGAMHLFFTRRFAIAGALVFLSLIGMVSVRHMLRVMLLDGTFDPASIPVSPQWSPFIMFLVCFIIAIGLVAYMLRLLFTDRRHAT